MVVAQLLYRWHRVSTIIPEARNGGLNRTIAGAEFAELVIQAAFGGKKVKTVQAYISLDADAGGADIKKEIGSDIEYFSVNIQLGVSGVSLRSNSS